MIELRDFFSIGIPLGILILLRKKSNNPFFFYILFGMLTEAFSLFEALSNGSSILQLESRLTSNTYSVIETGTYFAYLISLNSKFEKIYKISAFVSLLWVVYVVSFFDPGLKTFWPFAITSLVLMFMGLLGYYEILFTPEVTNPLKSSFFWINSAFFFYGASSTIIFLFIDSGLREEFKVMANLWIVGFGVVNALRYIFIGIGVYQKDMIY